MMGKEAVAGLGIIALLWTTILTAAKTTPIIGGWVGIIAGLIFLMVAWMVLMPFKLDGLHHIGALLIGVAVLNLALIQILGAIGMTIPDFGSVWMAALGLVLLWADNLKKLPFVGKIIGGSA